MRQQSKPFIVEIKQPRKLKPTDQPTDRKTAIWGKLALTLEQAAMTEQEPNEAPTFVGDNARP